MKIKFFKSAIILLALLRISFVNAATIDISNGGTTNVSDVDTSDTVNFLGNTGTLVIDVTESIAAITATTDQKGTVDFSTVSTLTVTGNIGATNAIQNIVFNADGTLISNGNISASSSGITTSANNQGNITLSGSTAQTISSIIGSSTLRLNTISITQGDGAVTFSGDVFANNLVTSSSGAAVTLAGVGGLNFTNSTFNQNTTINSSSTNSFGATTIADAKTLTVNSDFSLSTLTFGTSGNMVIASSKTANIAGNISGNGVIKGSVDGAGTVVFSGSSAQSVASTVELGDVSNRLSKVSISNISTSGLTLNNDVFTVILDAANETGTATTSIASGKTINVSGNITQSGAGSSVVKGAGKVLLSGSVAQTVDSKLGVSSSDRLGELEINNTGGIVLNQNSNLTTLTATGTTTITNNAVLDATTFAVDETTIVAGTGTNSFGATTIASAKNLTLNSSASLTNLTFGASGNLVVASGKTIDISGNITQSGAGVSVINGDGKVLLSGTSVQTINSTLGSSISDRLGEFEVNNSNGAIFTKDAFLTTLTQTSGAITINNSKTIDVTNAVSLSGKTLNIGIGASESLLGKIKSGGAVTINNATTISFDYSNNSLFTNHDGVTQFDVVQSSVIVGTVSDIIVTDNSFLFNNALALNGNNIVSTISNDATNFSASALGVDNFTLLNNALDNTNLTAGIISISSQQELTDGLSTLKPTANGAIVNTSMAISNAANNITKLHLQQISSNINEFAVDDKYESNEKLWGQIYGSRAKQDKINNVNGYVAGTGGLIFGADHLLKVKII